MKDRAVKGKSIIDLPDEYVCVDVETTGLDFEYDELIEIGAARVKDGTVVSEFSSLIRPQKPHIAITQGVLESLGLHNFSDLKH